MKSQNGFTCPKALGVNPRKSVETTTKILWMMETGIYAARLKLRLGGELVNPQT